MKRICCVGRNYPGQSHQQEPASVIRDLFQVIRVYYFRGPVSYYLLIWILDNVFSSINEEYQHTPHLGKLAIIRIYSLYVSYKLLICIFFQTGQSCKPRKRLTLSPASASTGLIERWYMASPNAGCIFWLLFQTKKRTFRSLWRAINVGWAWNLFFHHQWFRCKWPGELANDQLWQKMFLIKIISH